MQNSFGYKHMKAKTAVAVDLEQMIAAVPKTVLSKRNPKSLTSFSDFSAFALVFLGHIHPIATCRNRSHCF